MVGGVWWTLSSSTPRVEPGNTLVEAKDWNWDSLVVVVVVVVEQLKAVRPWSWRQLVGAQQHRPLSAAAELRSIQQGSQTKGNTGVVQVVNRGYQEARLE